MSIKHPLTKPFTKHPLKLGVGKRMKIRNSRIKDRTFSPITKVCSGCKRSIDLDKYKDHIKKCTRFLQRDRS